MSYNFEPCIFAEMEWLRYSSHSMASVGISSYVFEDALHANFHSGAAIEQHVGNVFL